MAFCKECGRDIGEAKFCPECGTPAGVQAKSQEQQASIGAFAQTPRERLAASTTQGAQGELAAPQQPLSKKRKKPLIITLSAVAVVIVAIVAIILVNPFGSVLATDEQGNAIDLKKAQVGDTIHLGEFAFQTHTYRLRNEPVESKDNFAWQVLDVQDGKALVISKDIIAREPYHESNAYITWETSSLRTWLNDDFYHSLPSGVQRRITETQLHNPNNPGYGTSGGRDTMDKVFLLSIDEANKYFPRKVDRAAESNIREDGYPLDLGIWWLRSPGARADVAAYVYGSSVDEYGGKVGTDELGVRPAFWITL